MDTHLQVRTHGGVSQYEALKPRLAKSCICARHCASPSADWQPAGTIRSADSGRFRHHCIGKEVVYTLFELIIPVKPRFT